MNMTNVNTDDLQGAQLDYAVGKILGYDVRVANDDPDDCFFWSPVWGNNNRDWKIHCQGDTWNPSANWAHGGPIIDREHIDLDHRLGREPNVAWRAVTTSAIKGPFDDFPRISRYGDTALIAAMRVFVASKIGPVVVVPVVAE